MLVVEVDRRSCESFRVHRFSLMSPCHPGSAWLCNHCDFSEEAAKRKTLWNFSPLLTLQVAFILFFKVLYSRWCLFLFVPMATSSRLSASLRRVSLSSRSSSYIQRVRPTIQVRWTGNTSATSEPHQPDEKGTVKGGAAPAKAIKFTSETYVNFGSPTPSRLIIP